MAKSPLLSRSLKLLGVLIVAHVVASYASAVSFGAWAWHLGSLNTSVWGASLPWAPLHWLQDWVFKMTLRMFPRVLHPSMLPVIAVISVGTYYAVFAGCVILWSCRASQRSIGRKIGFSPLPATGRDPSMHRALGSPVVA